MSKTSARQKQCIDFQEKMAKKREREYWHQQKWGNQVQYYKKWEKVNTKYDEWTSPRYYESNNDLIEKVKRDREKEDKLEKRRKKLKQLLSEDEASFEIELLLVKAKDEAAKHQKFEEIPTELLKDVNIGLKLEEDEKRRREAELQLYNQWRNNNPMIRDAERRRTTKDLKLSWLDQQIEKRMRKEKEDDEYKRILKERDKNIEEQKRKETIISEEVEKKNKEIQDFLVQQMEEMTLKQKESEELQKEEREDTRKKMQLAELEEKMRLAERRRKDRECALFNLRQHKMQLKKMAKEVEESLNTETDLIAELLNSHATDRIRNESKKREIKQALDEFLEYTKEQKLLEKRRREYMDFVFDSEAKVAYEKQKEIWDREENARTALLKDVLNSIGEQIDENIKKNKDRQRELLRERERMMEDVEKYEREMVENKRLEREKKDAVKKVLTEQITDKRTREKRMKEVEKRKIDIELENIRREEERLKKEIAKIQSSHTPMRYARKKPWY